MPYPLLRLSGWNADKQYDKNNPVCIHYDFRWKISQHENIRARHVCSDRDPDLVLAPGDFWTFVELSIGSTLVPGPGASLDAFH